MCHSETKTAHSQDSSGACGARHHAWPRRSSLQQRTAPASAMLGSDKASLCQSESISPISPVNSEQAPLATERDVLARFTLLPPRRQPPSRLDSLGGRLLGSPGKASVGHLGSCPSGPAPGTCPVLWHTASTLLVSADFIWKNVFGSTWPLVGLFPLIWKEPSSAHHQAACSNVFLLSETCGQ